MPPDGDETESPKARSFLVIMASAWHRLGQNVIERFSGPRAVGTEKHAPNEPNI
jgi:hypothetical protein